MTLFTNLFLDSCLVTNRVLNFAFVLLFTVGRDWVYVPKTWFYLFQDSYTTFFSSIAVSVVMWQALVNGMWAKAISTKILHLSLSLSVLCLWISPYFSYSLAEQKILWERQCHKILASSKIPPTTCPSPTSLHWYVKWAKSKLLCMNTLRFWSCLFQPLDYSTYFSILQVVCIHFLP